MKKILLIAIGIALSFHLNAQDKSASGTKKKPYFASSTELIFSWGDVKAASLGNGDYPKPMVRFSCFLHLQEQVNFDFGDKVGLYTGLSLRNVGFINDLNDTVRLKQRVYTLGIPVALKFGNMDGASLNVGAEAEFAIAYKQKVFVNDEKTKTAKWFSDRTNIFLPSVFAEFKLPQGLYFKFKYYLTDFLIEDKQKVNVNGVTFSPTQSTLMYASVGFTIKGKTLKK